ncbi:AAA ATPase [Rhodosporidiobolus nylandii]
MLGKRTRSSPSSPSDASLPLTPPKRAVLSAHLGSTKPALSSPTRAGKPGVTSSPMKRTASSKENEALPLEDAGVQAQEDVAMEDVEAFELPVPPAFDTHDDLFDVSAPPTPSAESYDASTPRAIPNIYAHASLLLSTSSSLSSALPLEGRADQRETLQAFLTRRFPSVSAPLAGSSTTPSTPSRPGPASMYVSGPPGIGKTALLSSVIEGFVEQVGERNLDEEVKVHMENCATVAAGGGEGAWDRLCAGLGISMEEKGNRKGKEVFEEGLNDGRSLLILDEIDHLVSTSSTSRTSSSSAPDLLNSLFALASTPASPLTLIGIANDLTLKALSLTPSTTPVKPSSGKGKSKPDPLHTPAKPVRLHFKPYSWQELVSIVAQRLALLSSSYPYLPNPSLPTPPATPAAKGAKPSYPLIAPPALERLCKKIASTTGDVRTVLSLVRTAIASSQPSLPLAQLAALTPSTAPKAGMPHLSKALAAASYAGSGLAPAPTLAKRLDALQSGPHHRLALTACVISLSRTLPLGLDAVSSEAASARVTLEDAFKVYRDTIIASADALRSTQLDAPGFADTLGMVEDLCGAIVVRGRPGGVGTSPTKGKSPGRPKKGQQNRVTVELSPSAPLSDLVAALAVAPKEGQESAEEEPVRLARRAIEREKADQRWRVKRREMGRDEERRAEEELEGREWERRLKAAEQDGGKA